ncbi:MAG: glutaredoxin domain-containing protein [Thermotogota bacterium]
MDKSITVYSTPLCPYCVMAKKFLKEAGYAFKDIDVSRDANAAERMVRKSGQRGVPVLEIGSAVIVGFDKARIKRALGIL